MKMEKKTFREHIRKLKALHLEKNDELYYQLSSQMTLKALDFISSRKYKKIAIFASKKESFEINTDDLIKHSLSVDKEVYLPRCVPRSIELEFLRITDLQADTEPGLFAIREPKKTIKLEDQDELLRELGVIFVPGMAFYEKNGKRLGYGNGYYDRFIFKLKSVNPSIPIIGLAFDFQIFSEPIPFNDHDSQVNYLISPTRIIKILN